MEENVSETRWKDKATREERRTIGEGVDTLGSVRRERPVLEEAPERQNG